MRFGRLLEQALKRRKTSQRAFCRAVGYRVQSLNQIIKGSRLPPPHRLDAWSRHLGDAVDPVAFREAGLLAHCPEEIQRLVSRLRRENRKREG